MGHCAFGLRSSGATPWRRRDASSTALPTSSRGGRSYSSAVPSSASRLLGAKLEAAEGADRSEERGKRKDTHARPSHGCGDRRRRCWRRGWRGPLPRGRAVVAVGRGSGSHGHICGAGAGGSAGRRRGERRDSAPRARPEGELVRISLGVEGADRCRSRRGRRWRRKGVGWCCSRTWRGSCSQCRCRRGRG